MANFRKIRQYITLKKIGFTRAGVQGYQYKTCKGTFTETGGTIFYRRRTPELQILETLALLAEENRISSLTRAKGYKEDAILEWLREAAAHAEQVEAVLMRDFHVKRGQLDALWAYVGRKKASPGGRRNLAINEGGHGQTAACGLPEA